MFIGASEGGYKERDGQQWARGQFLILLSGEGEHRRELRAIVRHTHLTQLGHFMMGTVRIGPDRVVVSGAYGGDGLPLYKTDSALMARLWAIAVPVPQELTEKFWSGGGHNSSGSEGPAMRKWAEENFRTLNRRLR